MSTSGGVGGGGLSSATAHLDAAAISTLFTVPTEIIPAPASNRALEVFGYAYQAIPGSSAWIGGDGGLYYAPAAAAGALIVQGLAQMDMLNTAGVTPQMLIATPPGGVVYAPADIIASAVIVAKSLSDPIRYAPIATTAISAPGAGYVVGDTGTIDSPGFGAATGYVVDTVGALGVVTSMHLALSDAGYSPGDGPFETTAGGAQPGIGTGLEINVLTIAAATGDLYVTAFYRTITTH